MFDNFPYTNFHEMNLDWIIKIAKDFLDQYSHIQDTITQGEQSLSDKTNEGLSALAEKADELETLLQAWYDTHSEDIAQQLTNAIAEFYSEADQKTAASIASIPSDYSELSAMVQHLNNTNMFNFTKMPYTTVPNQTLFGITWSTLDNGVIKAVGTNTGSVNAVNVYYYQSLPVDRLKPGSRILLYVNSSNPDSLHMQFFTQTSGGSLTHIYTNKNGFISFEIPSDVTAILWRAYVVPNATVNDTILPAIVIFPENSNYYMKMNPDFPLGYAKFGTDLSGETVDLDTLFENGFYLLTNSGTYLHMPEGIRDGFLQCVTTGRWHLQIIYNLSGSRVVKRRGTPDGTGWESWQELGGNGTYYNITNNYEYPSTTQNVQLTATPSITTDTNQYLASTNDTTDRTADILAMLTANKVCRLGPGVFYVNNLQMPEYSQLIGSGFITTVRLVDNVTGSAIKMNSYCTVENLRVEGDSYAPSLSATVGNRHGIEWSGNYQADGTSKLRGIINNVYIRYFTGGGITCYNTGYGTDNGLEVTNAWIWQCGAGINIAYFSEYHKFTNICAHSCYYGCVNNGGNNIFVNCDFSSNLEYGFVIDNSQGQSPNNSHGSCVGCVFNHESHNGTANSGTGILIMNAQYGFVFTGCQVFFSKITIENSKGVNFSDCNIGYENCNIFVSGGGLTIFNNLQFQNTPTISVSDNTQTHFINCYNITNGELVTN